jgi:hypothetical protein
MKRKEAEEEERRGNDENYVGRREGNRKLKLK